MAEYCNFFCRSLLSISWWFLSLSPSVCLSRTLLSLLNSLAMALLRVWMSTVRKVW